MKVYNCAPLPFQGQKRRFVRDFKEIAMQFENANVFIDLFGGSGLLSHTVKRIIPEAKVIYNDFDNYSWRLLNVSTTNKILREIRPLVADIPNDKKIPIPIKLKILEILDKHSRDGLIDYITIGSSLLFSGKYAKSFAELEKQTFYNCLKRTDYVVDGYLDGLEVVHKDYKALYNEYKNNPNAIFLIDPPYLSTEVGSYECYWKLNDYLDVLKCLENTRYVYFTSCKSQILELCKWMRDNPDIGDPFNGAEIRTRKNDVNYNCSFIDIMLVKGTNT